MGVNCEINISNKTTSDSACPLNSYGENCSVVCIPQDDCLGHFTCDQHTGERHCKLKWTGPNCTLPSVPLYLQQCPDISSSSGCRNGGTCFNNRCCCRPGYEGELCQTETVECISNPCHNGGVCVDEIGAYKCVCPQGRNTQHSRRNLIT